MKPAREQTGPTPLFRTVGATTLWDAEQAWQMLEFLDALRHDIWAAYGEQIERQRHEDECAGAEHQQELDLDDLPF